MPTFIPGLELCGLFFREAVQPVLDAEFSGLRYDAALTGPGSEVLGYDAAKSTDHNWGPRVSLFLSEADHPRYVAAITETLRHRLPYTFAAMLPAMPARRGSRKARNAQFYRHWIRKSPCGGLYSA